MLLAFLLIQAAGPIAVDVAGMPPQIAFLRQVAAEHHWPVICEGRSGEEQVLRLETRGADAETVSAALDDRPSHSSYYYKDNQLPGPTCNLEPPHGSGDPIFALGFGTETQLTPLLEIARACGFSRARIRERRPGDLPARFAHRIPAAMLTLSAEEDIMPRYGPTICFVHMRPQPAANLPRRAASSRGVPC